MIANTDTLAGASQDFARFTELQQLLNTARTNLDELEVKMNRCANKAAEMNAAEYVVLQEQFAGLEKDLTKLFEKHPEWRQEKKSVKTPFGEVAQRTVTELHVANPAATVALIEARGKTDPDFKADDFLHKEVSPNLEALEGMSDDELSKLGVTRKTREQITVKPAKVNVAKAVKAAKGKEVKA